MGRVRPPGALELSRRQAIPQRQCATRGIRLLRFLSALLVCALLLVGCGGSGGDAAPRETPCPSAEAISDLSLLPKDIDLSAFGDVVSARVRRGFLLVEVHSDMLIVEADPPLQRDLIANGYQVLSHDNEGFEAEIYFARGPKVVGTYTLRELCEGRIKISLVYGSERYENM